PLLELAHPGGADDLIVDPDRLAAACGRPLPPLEQQARRGAVRAGHERHRHARLQRLLNQPDLLRPRPPPAALHRGDHLDALDLLRHSRTPRLMPRPSRYATCPPETGAAPETTVSISSSGKSATARRGKSSASMAWVARSEGASRSNSL